MNNLRVKNYTCTQNTEELHRQIQTKYNSTLEETKTLLTVLSTDNCCQENLWTPHPCVKRPGWMELWVTQSSGKHLCPGQWGWNEMTFEVHSKKQVRIMQPITQVTTDIKYRDALNNITIWCCWARAQKEPRHASVCWPESVVFPTLQHPHTQTC